METFGFDPDIVNSHGFEIFNETGLLNATGTDSWNWTNGTSWRSTATPHAAITIGCEDCHYNATLQLNNTYSAHRPLYQQARNSTGGTNNTACLACHTMVGLNITMERVYSGINITANHTNYTLGNAWNLTVNINQTARTTNSTYLEPNSTT